MTVATILENLDAEIGRLQQARALLTDLDSPSPTSPRRGRPKGATTAKPPSPKKRTLSPEARARIAAAQKARWAKRQPES